MQLKEEYQTLFHHLQKQLLKRLHWPGRIDYEKYRSCNKPNIGYKGFIDGNIIEKYLTIPVAMQEEIFYSITVLFYSF